LKKLGDIFLDIKESSFLRTIEGIYQNGHLELSEQPPTTDKQVLVTFLDDSITDPLKLRQLIDQLETIAGLQQGFEELKSQKLSVVWTLDSFRFVASQIYPLVNDRRIDSCSWKNYYKLGKDWSCSFGIKF
jgi:hypothetical protein